MLKKSKGGLRSGSPSSEVGMVIESSQTRTVSARFRSGAAQRAELNNTITIAAKRGVKTFWPFTKRASVLAGTRLSMH